jgi:hypothetical protein
MENTAVSTIRGVMSLAIAVASLDAACGPRDLHELYASGATTDAGADGGENDSVNTGGSAGDPSDGGADSDGVVDGTDGVDGTGRSNGAGGSSGMGDGATAGSGGASNWIDLSHDPTGCIDHGGAACGWGLADDHLGLVCGDRHPEWTDGVTCEQPNADKNVAIWLSGVSPTSVTVNWRVGSLTNLDWIGVYPLDTQPAPMNSQGWDYTKGRTTGSMKINARYTTFQSGIFKVYYFVNDTFNAAAWTGFSI